MSTELVVRETNVLLARNLRALGLFYTCVLCVACAGYKPGGSGGGYITPTIRDYDPVSKISWRYENEIEFPRSLVVSVDSLLSRLKNPNNHDAWALIQDFMRPANNLLVTRYDTNRDPLSFEPQVDYKMKSFSVPLNAYEQISDSWANQYPRKLRNGNALRRLLRTNSGKYRWEVRVPVGDVSFNSMNPKIISIKAELEIWVQRFDHKTDRFENVNFDYDASDDEAQRLRIELNKEYYRYLQDKFGITITPSFGGFDEE